MESGSDEALAVGASLSVGLAVGLLLGGANRLLVVLALIPATAMTFTLLDRYAGRSPLRVDLDDELPSRRLTRRRSRPDARTRQARWPAAFFHAWDP